MISIYFFQSFFTICYAACMNKRFSSFLLLFPITMQDYTLQLFCSFPQRICPVLCDTGYSSLTITTVLIYTKQHSTFKATRLTSTLRRPMQHDIDFWAAETIRLCVSCYTGVFWRLTAHVCPCLHHLKPHLHKQILQCFSIPLEALWLTLQEPVIDFCQCTRNRYLGKVHVPGRGTEPGFHCVKCNLWFFSCEIELFCMIQGLAWWP